jgi:hypothetical protein
MKKKPQTQEAAVETTKEKYRIMVEYLKESAEYEYLCQHKRSHTFNDFLNKAIQTHFGNNSVTVDVTTPDNFPEEEDFHRDLLGLNPIFKDMEVGEAIALFFRRNDRKKYRFFGNIHVEDYDFNLWWDQYASKLIKKVYEAEYGLFKLDDEKIAMYAEELAEFLIEAKNGSYGKQLQREGFESLIRKHYHDWHGETPGRITIQIDTLYPVETLKQQLADLIEKHNRHFCITSEVAKEYLNLTFPVPVRDVTINELSHYIEVYRAVKQYRKDHNKKPNWNVIVKKLPHIFLKSESLAVQLNDSIRVKFYRYLDRAEKIIKHLENEDRAFPIIK